MAPECQDAGGTASPAHLLEGNLTTNLAAKTARTRAQRTARTTARLEEALVKW
jgi:hypothetical protein